MRRGLINFWCCCSPSNSLGRVGGQFYRGAARSVSLSHLLPPRGPPLRPGGGGTPDPKSPPSRGGGIFLSPGKFALAGHFPGFPPPLPGSYRVSSRPGARRPVCGRDTRHSRGFFRSRSAALSSSLGSHKSPVTHTRCFVVASQLLSTTVSQLLSNAHQRFRNKR